jgi:outer membrane protein TolC
MFILFRAVDSKDMKKIVALFVSAISLMFVIAAGAFAADLPAGVEKTLTVDEAVSLAVSQNLGLGRAKIDLDIKERAAARSWNFLYPTVNAGGQASHATPLLSEAAVGDAWKPGLSLSASLSLSPSSVAAMKQATAEYDAGRLSFEEAKQALELQVRKLFYQILLLRANVELAGQNVESAQARAAQTAALARVGQASHLNELSAQVDLENLKPTLHSAQTQYENALESFELVLGLPPDTHLALEGSLEAGIAPLELGDVSPNESWSTLAALATARSLEAQKKALQLTAYAPRLSLSWNESLSYANEAWADSSSSFTLGLSFNLDSLLPASASRTKMADLEDGLKKSDSQLREARLDQESRVRQNLRTLEQSAQTIKALTLNITLAEQSYEMTAEAYRQGAVDLQQLRASADSLSLAKNRLASEY